MLPESLSTSLERQSSATAEVVSAEDLFFNCKEEAANLVGKGGLAQYK